MVWNPLFLDPSDGVFGRFDLAALCGCCTLNVCLFVIEATGHVRGHNEGWRSMKQQKSFSYAEICLVQTFQVCPTATQEGC